MTCSVALPWDAQLLGYDFGPAHPLAPVRVELTLSLARALGVIDAVRLTPVRAADDDRLATVHQRGYIEAVKRAGETLRPDPSRGLGTPDDPVFADMHQASALVAGASVVAAQAVMSGETDHGLNVAGGLHHAMAGRASGFCVYNDPAIAIAWLLEHGAARVAYVDIDVHHGDGVQAAFWDDPRVLTVSLHQSGATLFPGTGSPSEVGGPRARGRAVNVGLPPGTTDAGWHEAFDAVVPDVLRCFAPSYLVTQHGCDTHTLDPLADLSLSVDGQQAAHAKLHALAHEVCDGRWVATGGGGYSLVQVVPRSWTHLIAEAAGRPVAPEVAIPQTWQDEVHRRTGEAAPTLMTDGRAADPVVDARVLAAIDATRAAVFPHLGLNA
jgi:acetoin utilization protein AcuC